jgi:hypothetical protein
MARQPVTRTRRKGVKTGPHRAEALGLSASVGTLDPDAPRAPDRRRALLKAAGVGAASLALPWNFGRADARAMPRRAYYYLWWSREHWHDKLGHNFPYGRSPLPLPATLNAAGCHAHSRYAGNSLTDVRASSTRRTSRR